MCIPRIFVNSLTGGRSQGSPCEQDSNHLTGYAADIRCRDGEQAMRYAALLIDLFREAGRKWDEIIVEKKRSTRFWVHFAVKPETNRYTPNRCKVTVIELK